MTTLHRALLVLTVLFPLIALGQSADQAIVSVIDAPDPVIPGQTLTYTVTFQNNGPNPAVNGGVNLLFDGNFTPTSVTPPAGFTCTALAQVMTCNTPSFAPGAPLVLTATGTVAAHLINFADGTLTSSFTTSGVTADPNSGNNSSGNIVTSYNSPQMDLAIAVADSPDPVGPDGNITYTVDIVNNGPDPATSVNFNSFNNGTLRYQSIVIPTGWSCPSQPAVNGNPTFTCTKPVMAGLETAQFIVVIKADDEALGINDGTVQMVFGVNGIGDDTNDNNNQEIESTQYVTPDADVAIAVTDSPDPVFPDGNITYTVTVSNNGPDTAPNITLSSFGGNNLRFQSATVPAGWNCTLPAAGTQTTSYSCTHAGLVSGASSVLTFVMQADDALLGINDGTILFGYSAGSTIADPVPGNNSETESTQYTTPDADIQVTASDSPDPVFPDGDITYTVTVQNAGPDTAPNVILNVPMNGTLRFQSVITPAGWTCTPPAVGGGTSWSCTIASLPVQPASTFTIVLRANDEQFGINDQVINQAFSAGSSIADPVNGNNTVIVATQYATPDANVSITASDAPDPVVNGSNLTYTVNVANAGPDAGPNAVVNLPLHPSLTFQSLAAPAGWSCTTPAVNATGLVQCTLASMANAENGQFTLVAKLVAAGAGGTISSTFSIGTSAQDPVHANNSIEVFTNWIGAVSDLAITKNTLSTAAAQGSTITYTISTTNNGPDSAANATITDVLPAQLLFQSIAAPAGWTCTTPAVGANGTVTCNAAVLANGATANFTLTTTVAPNATGTITNTATAGSSSSDPNGGNSGGSAGAVAVAGNADLSINKTGNPGTASRGDTINYVLSITNGGPDPAASVVMTDVLPASLLFQSISAPGWSCTTPTVGSTGTVTCTIASLGLGLNTIGLSVTVAPNATGSITNTASVAHSGTDGNPGNSSVTSGPTGVLLPSADLSINKSTATTTVTPGQTFAYTISLTNSGPDAASPVTITDTLPSSLLFQSIDTLGWNCTTPTVGTTGTITCTATTLASGATATLTLNVQVANGASGTITNTASVASDTPDPDSGDISSTTPPIPVTTPSADVSIVKTTTATTVTTGTVFNYTITVTNAGPSTATNVVVTDTLPAQLELVAATPSQGTCNATSPVSCNMGSILNGANATIVLQVRAVTAGSVTNGATVVSAEGGTDSDDAPTILVTGGPAEGEPIPTLSEWALIALMGMLGLIAAVRMRT